MTTAEKNIWINFSLNNSVQATSTTGINNFQQWYSGQVMVGKTVTVRYGSFWGCP